MRIISLSLLALLESLSPDEKSEDENDDDERYEFSTGWVVESAVDAEAPFVFFASQPPIGLHLLFDRYSAGCFSSPGNVAGGGGEDGGGEGW
ncbi:hypothetical protein PsorP6_010919 [Peronosclerospora sorghi]|uniref:Uncharacterized protein n=1 Tax=Peronosclerospora sorghi TaxID=230839 RepID=A0ACC0VTQ9_9STRA|nr:hypothetical protein PsorP6_010919 [Peronosclerospora sorghi]